MQSSCFKYLSAFSLSPGNCHREASLRTESHESVMLRMVVLLLAANLNAVSRANTAIVSVSEFASEAAPQFYWPGGQNAQELPQLVRLDAFQEERVLLARPFLRSVRYVREGEHSGKNIGRLEVVTGNAKEGSFRL